MKKIYQYGWMSEPEKKGTPVAVAEDEGWAEAIVEALTRLHTNEWYGIQGQRPRRLAEQEHIREKRKRKS